MKNQRMEANKFTMNTATTTSGGSTATACTTVAKFGGSSLCDSSQFIRVKIIIQNQEDRGVIVVSAPGKRYSEDIKVTDLLIQCHAVQTNALAHRQELNELMAEIVALEESMNYRIAN